MNQKVYVIFGNHEDEFRPDCEWNGDWFHEYVTVVGTEDEARSVIQHLVLRDYYDAVTNADYEIEQMDKYPDYYEEDYDFLKFDIREDKGNSIEYDYHGDINTWYYEEVEITN